MNKEIMQSYFNYIDGSSTDKQTKSTNKKVISDYINHLAEVTIAKATIKHLNAYLLQLSELKPSTYNLRISLLRQFYQWLHDKQIALNWGEYLVKKKEPKILPKNIPLHLMIKLCTPTEDESPFNNKGLRNQAIIEFMFATGVRSIELRKAKLKYLSEDLSECFIATAKCGVPRYVYLGEPAQQALKAYLNTRGICFEKGLSKSELELPIFTANLTKTKAIDYQTLKDAITALSIQRIGLVVSPHMIRHTFATEMLRANGNIRALQILMGHKKIDSTMVYCHLCTTDKIKAIKAHHPMSFSQKFDKL